VLTVADTAYAIAFIRASESERPGAERLFEDPYAALFDAAGGHAREGTRRFVELPFLVDAVRLRTRFIDDFVREGLAAGIRQVVLLGAGFDARGLRMPEIAAHDATVYEIDVAAQLAQKRALLAAAGIALPPWMAHVACDFNVPDFGEALGADLGQRGFRRDAATLFVWEGVVAYLDAAAVDRSLGFMARSGSGPGTRLVFDFAPMSWDPDPAIERTRRAGFTRFEQLGYGAIWRRYLPGEPHAFAAVPHMGMAFV
jgi:methyltransferase (TIGR00027 family)